MQSNRNIYLVLITAVVLAWTLSAPSWFARGALGRAMTDLDIWAQVHLPYPVLTLLLLGVAGAAAVIWFRRRLHDDDHSSPAWSRHERRSRP